MLGETETPCILYGGEGCAPQGEREGATYWGKLSSRSSSRVSHISFPLSLARSTLVRFAFHTSKKRNELADRAVAKLKDLLKNPTDLELVRGRWLLLISAKRIGKPGSGVEETIFLFFGFFLFFFFFFFFFFFWLLYFDRISGVELVAGENLRFLGSGCRDDCQG